MMIPVMFRDGKMGCADQYQLDKLINMRQIIKFRRENGWAYIGFDPIRMNDNGYRGVERRATYPATRQ